ncbi:hypothetical protein H6F86_20940 [Phormidium sp. FACHB-592]|uniref:Uncharacterized protein n=1 Tax=Stenomitos frigidus AS-A4 TaxID=2933935 RepID=A0ABV0KF41_9CYAN|nr:hypothetical protein [Phormidium sp. FACHB-592]MBD2076301.1 hypothetical protein [Phormidium sp. FACHB-592]
MDDFEREFTQAMQIQSAPVAFSRRERIQPMPKQAAADFFADHWMVLAGVGVLAASVFASLPAQLRNSADQARLAETVRPISAQFQLDAALNGLAAQKNQIAEDRFSNPNCVVAAAVISGEPVYNIDRRLVSAGSTVCGLDGSTGVVIGHPTGRLDHVTGTAIMRPIADKVYSSKGAAFAKFKAKWGKS